MLTLDTWNLVSTLLTWPRTHVWKLSVLPLIYLGGGIMELMFCRLSSRFSMSIRRLTPSTTNWTSSTWGTEEKDCKKEFIYKQDCLKGQFSRGQAQWESRTEHPIQASVSPVGEGSVSDSPKLVLWLNAVSHYFTNGNEWKSIREVSAVFGFVWSLFWKKLFLVSNSMQFEAWLVSFVRIVRLFSFEHPVDLLNLLCSVYLQYWPQICPDGRCYWCRRLHQQKQCPHHQYRASAAAGCSVSRQTEGVCPGSAVSHEHRHVTRYPGCSGKWGCSPSAGSTETPSL